MDLFDPSACLLRSRYYSSLSFTDGKDLVTDIVLLARWGSDLWICQVAYFSAEFCPLHIC